MNTTTATDEEKQDGATTAATTSDTHASCDYLIVGAGTACLSFVDTLLTELPDVTFILVDRNSRPGGHWVHSYPYVRLHQQSCSYGVNSVPLGKLDHDNPDTAAIGTNMNKKKKTKKKKKKKKKVVMEPYDMSDRATGEEICAYYKKVVDQFVQTTRVQTYWNTNYNGPVSETATVSPPKQQNPKQQLHSVTRIEDGRTMTIECSKVVRCETKVVVPGMRHGVPFPIDESVIRTIPLNELPNRIHTTDNDNTSHNIHYQQDQKYLVIGAGKSGVDAIVYLLEDGNVDPDRITWVVSRSVWYMLRDGMLPDPKPGKKYYKRVKKQFFEPIVNANSSEEAIMNLERVETIGRIDPNGGIFPTVFKAPMIMKYELDLLRSLKNVISDKGRITSITSTEMRFEEKDDTGGYYTFPFSADDTLVVDCTADDTYGYLDFEEDFEIFNPDGRIRLGPIVSLFNPSYTSAFVAYLESQFVDDAVKNSFLYFLRGEHDLREMTYLQRFLLSWYAEMKTIEQLMKHKPFTKFMMTSRTNHNAPAHHGGMLNLLWALFGPLRLQKSADAFVKKMETGGYSDFPTRPWPERTGVDPKLLSFVLRKPKKKRGSKNKKRNKRMKE